MTYDEFVNYMHKTRARFRVFMVFYAIPVVAIVGPFACLVDVIDGSITVRRAFREYLSTMRDMFVSVRSGRWK